MYAIDGTKPRERRAGVGVAVARQRRARHRVDGTAGLVHCHRSIRFVQERAATRDNGRIAEDGG
ncbi:hypothetical protein A8H40_01225 [Burkholderia multivorans]|nr:hypothetical protein A8H40_01225 [Burkholderia multivorans]PRD89739.1 hypothetical protein C6P76_05985 [Burkholderia multivorans]